AALDRRPAGLIRRGASLSGLFPAFRQRLPACSAGRRALELRSPQARGLRSVANTELILSTTFDRPVAAEAAPPGVVEKLPLPGAERPQAAPRAQAPSRVVRDLVA